MDDTVIIVSMKHLFTEDDIKPIAAEYASVATELEDSKGFHLLCEILESQLLTDDVLDVLYKTTFEGEIKDKIRRCAFVVDNSAVEARIKSCLETHSVESIGIFRNKGRAMKELVE